MNVILERFNVQCSMFNVQCSMFNVQCSRFKVHGSRLKVQGSRFKVHGSRFEVQGLRFKVMHRDDDKEHDLKKMLYYFDRLYIFGDVFLVAKKHIRRYVNFHVLKCVGEMGVRKG